MMKKTPDDDVNTRRTNHDGTGSLAFMPNESRKENLNFCNRTKEMTLVYTRKWSLPVIHVWCSIAERDSQAFQTLTHHSLVHFASSTLQKASGKHTELVIYFVIQTVTPSNLTSAT